MEIDEIKKKLAEWEQKTALSAEGAAKLSAATSPPPVEEPAPIVAEVVPAGAEVTACFSKDFKKLVAALPESYVGQNIGEFKEVVANYAECGT